MEKKLMNDIINDVEKLKEKILLSNEYKNFKEAEKILDSNKEINKIIGKIKQVQQQIVKKEDKKEETDKEEIELQSLYKQLDTYKEYTNYIQASKIFNELITSIQKEFESYFNGFII